MDGLENYLILQAHLPMDEQDLRALSREELVDLILRLQSHFLDTESWWT